MMAMNDIGREIDRYSAILVFDIWAYTPQILRIRSAVSLHGLSALFLSVQALSALIT
jgi:hypothetical protein